MVNIVILIHTLENSVRWVLWRASLFLLETLWKTTWGIDWTWECSPCSVREGTGGGGRRPQSLQGQGRTVVMLSFSPYLSAFHQACTLSYSLLLSAFKVLIRLSGWGREPSLGLGRWRRSGIVTRAQAFHSYPF